MNENKIDYKLIILPIIFSFIFQFILGYNYKKGVIEILDFNNSSIIKIENLMDKNIDNFIVLIPLNYDIDLIKSNYSISITNETEEKLLRKDKKIIKFSLIPSNSKTVIYFNNLTSEDILLKNFESFNLEIISSYNKFDTLLVRGIFNTIFYGIFGYLIYIYVNKNINERKLEIKSLRSEIENLKNINEKNTEINIKNEKRIYTTYLIDNEILLFYKKEIEFWRKLFFDKLNIKEYEKKKFLEEMEKEFKTSNKFKVNYEERLKTFEIMKEIFEKEIKEIKDTF